MADPFTAFAAAGNVLQFAELGTKLIRKTIHYAHNGGTNEHQSLQDITQRLIVSNAHLQDYLSENGNSYAQPGPLRALYQANMECLTLSQELVALLEKLKFNRSGSSWKSVKMALRSLSSSPKIQALEERVAHARLNLMLSFMVYMATQTKSAEPQKDFEARIIQEVHKAARVDKAFWNDVNCLAQNFSNLKVDTDNAYKAMSDTLSSQKEVLADLSRNLDVTLRNQSQDLGIFSDKLHTLLGGMDREIQARRKVLDSLYFHRMNDRRNHITHAHDQTYQWILRPKEDDATVWDSFIDWLKADGGPSTYWIRGKAGSGKSTLMRELDERIPSYAQSGTWFAGAELITASCFFWCSGTSDQKSLFGLLVSLVHQLFRQRPDTIDRVISADRWERALHKEAQMPHWDNRELEESLREFVQHIRGGTKILFLIDGLDEYDGTDEERIQMIKILEHLTSIGQVKVCLSSRPWVIYKDAFKFCPQLRLEELTKGDISQYVHDTLQENELFCRCQKRHPDLLNDLANEIIRKADGVFLWVRLVVRDLLKAVRDGARADDLIRKLHGIPPDLDEYFMRMIHSIDQSYRKEASMILQTALCNMDYTAYIDRVPSSKSTPEFLLIDLYYLTEYKTAAFAAEDSFQPLNYLGDDSVEIEYLLDSLDRRLTSRCMGLLEANLVAIGNEMWEAKVEFLHRTVKDFLCTPGAQRVLFGYTNGPYEAHLFRCNVLVAHAMSFEYEDSAGFALIPERVSCFLGQIETRAKEKEVLPHSLYEKMISVLGEKYSETGGFRTGFEEIDDRLSDALGESSTQQNLAVTLAIQFGWWSYAKAKLTPQLLKSKKGRPLIDYALRPCLGTPCGPHPEIVRHLLDMGADPNHIIVGSSRDQATISNSSSDWREHVTGAAVGVHFIVGLVAVEAIDDSLQTLITLFQHGVKQWISEPEIDCAFEEFYNASFFQIELDGVRRDLYDRLASYSSRCMEIDSSRCTKSYRVLDILRCLLPVDSTEVTVFSGDDIDILEEALTSLSSEVDNSKSREAGPAQVCTEMEDGGCEDGINRASIGQTSPKRKSNQRYSPIASPEPSKRAKTAR